MFYKLKDHITLNESGILFNTQTGDSFSLNEPGILILEKVRKNFTLNQIKDFLLAEYDIENGILEEDLHQFFDSLLYQQLADEIPEE
jgi:hypothetical protein